MGKTRRTTDEIKKRWQDIRRITKEKIAHNKTLANKTGGGPAEETPLSKLEQQVHLTFCDEQIIGIQGYDTLEPETANRGRPIITQTQFFLVDTFHLFRYLPN